MNKLGQRLLLTKVPHIGVCLGATLLLFLRFMKVNIYKHVHAGLNLKILNLHTEEVFNKYSPGHFQSLNYDFLLVIFKV